MTFALGGRARLPRAAQVLDRRILVHRHTVEPTHSAQVHDALTRPRHRRDGLVVALHDTPAVRAALRAVEEELTAQDSEEPEVD